MQQFGSNPSQKMLDQLRCFCTSYKCHAAFDENAGLSGVLVSRRTYDRHQKDDEDAETIRANTLAACVPTETPLGINGQWFSTIPDVDTMQSTHNAYTSLMKENSILSSKIEMQRVIISGLEETIEAQQIILSDLKGLLGASNGDIGGASFISASTSSGHTAPPRSTTRLPSDSTIVVDQYKELPATIPCPPLDKSSFPDVPFWTRSSWNDYVTKEAELGRKHSAMMFLTDRRGNQLSENIIYEIESTARASWAQMALANYAPNDWNDVAQVPADYFYNTMQTAHPEFSYADGPWKCCAYGVLHYVSWKAESAPRLLTKTKEDSTYLDWDSTDISHTPRKRNRDDIDNEEKQAKRWRIDEATVSVGTRVDTTNLNMGEGAECPPESGSKHPSLASVDVCSPSPPMPAINDFEISVPHIVSGIEHSAPASALIDVQPLPSPLTAATASVDSDMAAHNRPLPKHASLSTIPRNVKDLGPLIQHPMRSQSESAAIETIQTTEQSTLQKVWNSVDTSPLANDATYTLPTPSKIEKPKKGKLAHPLKVISARNLFMTDYLKENGDVALDTFKAVFKSLDKATLKKYTIQAKKLKADIKCVQRTTTDSAVSDPSEIRAEENDIAGSSGSV